MLYFICNAFPFLEADILEQRVDVAPIVVLERLPLCCPVALVVSGEEDVVDDVDAAVDGGDVGKLDIRLAKEQLRA